MVESDWPEDDEALLEISEDGRQFHPENYWSLRDAFEGVQVFGGTGSGKSSGSGQALARAFLSSNLGGLVLTAKTDEAEQWKALAASEGRGGDIIEVTDDGHYQFNFLSYELKRAGAGAAQTESLVNLFCAVLESAERRQGQVGGSDAYWSRALKQLLRNAIDLAVLAMDEVDLISLYRIITSAPSSIAEADDAAWQKSSACFALLEHAQQKHQSGGEADDVRLVVEFFLREFALLANETRSVIISTFTSMADCFMRGTLRKLFCEGLNYSPEDCFEGKIIILNLPVKEFNELGQFAQVLFKFVWQRAVERRIPPGIAREEAQRTIRPVFLFADEAQFFINSYDALFQSTARSSRACTVYLTQNLPTYFAAFGGPNGRHEAESFVANLQTKIAHANGDPTTNLWMADSIGRTRQIQLSGGVSEGATSYGRTNLNLNAGGNMVYEYPVQPAEFTNLATGGPDHDYRVGAVIFQGGRNWIPDGKERRNFIRHHFSQR
ncbi:MAG: TraM recognition domain-containing protein [Verrucomicrobiota bacterium]